MLSVVVTLSPLVRCSFITKIINNSKLDYIMYIGKYIFYSYNSINICIYLIFSDTLEYTKYCPIKKKKHFLALRTFVFCKYSSFIFIIPIVSIVKYLTLDIRILSLLLGNRVTTEKIGLNELNI